MYPIKQIEHSSKEWFWFGCPQRFLPEVLVNLLIQLYQPEIGEQSQQWPCQTHHGHLWPGKTNHHRHHPPWTACDDRTALTLVEDIQFISPYLKAHSNLKLSQTLRLQLNTQSRGRIPGLSAWSLPQPRTALATQQQKWAVPNVDGKLNVTCQGSKTGS